MFTPWGHADHVADIGKGIKQVDTPSHGGYYVPCDVLKTMKPEALKTVAGRGWYEEDCDWCLVALSFPELFMDDSVEAARRTCAFWMRPEVCAAFGIEPDPKNIHIEKARGSR